MSKKKKFLDIFENLKFHVSLNPNAFTGLQISRVGTFPIVVEVEMHCLEGSVAIYCINIDSLRGKKIPLLKFRKLQC